MNSHPHLCRSTRRSTRRSPAVVTASVAALAVAGLLPLTARATNGYFAHGYGAAALGAAGVGIALPQDGLAAATNPAGTARVGERADIGLTLFLPDREARIDGNAFGADASYDGNGRKTFAIPEIGYVRSLGGALTGGIAVYGNGGMNTDYASNPYARFGASGSAGVNLEQLFVSPSLAWTPAPGQSLGVALNLAYQRFSAKGIGFFGGFSSDPSNVSDRGSDSSTGIGLRLGWLGNLTPTLQGGLTWASKTDMGRFKKYAGLFADQGDFDIPENYGAGLAWQAAPGWTIAADVQRIRYSQVGAVGNSLAPLLSGVPLGAAGGPGFGWRDMTVTKLAVQHAVSPTLTLRGGYSHGRQPVPAGETFFNILAPGVVQDHWTAGFTLKPVGSHLEWTGYAALGRGHTVAGQGSIPPGNPPGGFGGGEATVRLKETLFGLSVGWRY